ncbi:MAG: elongation factor P [Gemmatales bacterium]|nr:elongation factor P [Gemmatales bacterium]MDW8223277.1 elongation factor P [Gemmatales bacterium]
MISASELKKGTVITLDGAHWIVEDYHIQKTAQRKPVLQVRLRNMRTGHVVERSFSETDRVEVPEVATRPFQYLYEDHNGYVFMDVETFDQITVPAEIIGKGKWLLREGAEFAIRLVEGHPVQVVFPPNFVDEVVETGEGSASGHASNVLKDAKLACGLEIKVPQFIRIGDMVRVDTETHKYLGKESAKKG